MTDSENPGTSQLGAFDGSRTRAFVASQLKARNRIIIEEPPPPPPPPEIKAYRQIIIIISNRSTTTMATNGQEAKQSAPFGYVDTTGLYESAGMYRQTDGSIFQTTRGNTFYASLNALMDFRSSVGGGWFSPHVMHVRKLIKRGRERAFGNTVIELWHTPTFSSYFPVTPLGTPAGALKVDGVAGSAWADRWPQQLGNLSPYPYLLFEDIFSAGFNAARITYRRLPSGAPTIANLIQRVKNSVMINNAMQSVRNKRVTDPQVDWRMRVVFVLAGPFRFLSDGIRSHPRSDQFIWDWMTALRELSANDTRWPLLISTPRLFALSDPLGESHADAQLSDGGFWLARSWEIIRLFINRP